MRRVAKKWLYLRAFKPGDADGRYLTLQVDAIEPTGKIEKASVIQEAVILMQDADAKDNHRQNP